MTADANVMTKAEFAAARGVSKSRVSQWAQAGRLVLDEKGRVKVAESDERLALTSSPRGAPKAHSVARPSNSMVDAAYQARQIDNARRARSEAELAEMKAARARGELLRTDSIVGELDQCARIIVRHLDQFPHRIYLQLAAEGDEHKCLLILEDAMREVRTSIADEITQLHQTIAQVAQAQAADA